MSHEARAAPSREELTGLLDKMAARLMKLLTRQGDLIEEHAMTYLADIDADKSSASLQAAPCAYRTALGPRAGQKVLRLHTVTSRQRGATGAASQASSVPQRSRNSLIESPRWNCTQFIVVAHLAYQ